MIKGSCLCGAVLRLIDPLTASQREILSLHELPQIRGYRLRGVGLGANESDRHCAARAECDQIQFRRRLQVCLCTVCEVLLFGMNRRVGPSIRGIPLGAIDEGAVANPEMHVWTKSRQYRGDTFPMICRNMKRTQSPVRPA